MKAVKLVTTAVALGIVTAGALAEGNPQKGKGGPRGAGRGARGMGPGNPDQNGDLIVDEQEAQAAAQARIERARAMLDKVRERADANNDGVVDQAEKDRLEEHTAKRGGRRAGVLHRVDEDGDLEISDAEAETAVAAITERFEKRNERILKRFDENGDGTLDETEVETAKEAIAEHRAHRQQRGKGKAQQGRDRKGGRRQMRQRMLERFDEDGDGTLSEDEKAAMREALGALRGRGRRKNAVE